MSTDKTAEEYKAIIAAAYTAIANHRSPSNSKRQQKAALAECHDILAQALYPADEEEEEYAIDDGEDTRTLCDPCFDEFEENFEGDHELRNFDSDGGHKHECDECQDKDSGVRHVVVAQYPED